MTTRQIVRAALDGGLSAAADELRTSVYRWANESKNTSSMPTLEPLKVPSRQGYEWGIPRGGTAASAYQLGALGGSSRQQTLEQLNDAYLQCIWASACIDAIAKAATAGGMEIVPNADQPEEAAVPPQVIELRRLLRFTNPRENMIQLVRSSITDLYVTGDAFVEQTFLLGQPVALYTVDAATMNVDADEHGQVLSYTQRIDGIRDPVVFEPSEIIHISLDAPRGGLYGTSPLLKALIPIVCWLFTMADLKEQMRAGNPPRVHIDLPKDNQTAVEVFFQKYVGRYLGAKGVTRPILTTRGGTLNELAGAKIVELLDTLKDCRDQIISVLGVPPQKVQIVESGNLGGGTGESQDKNWRLGTLVPIQALWLEAFNFTVVQQGFGITTHHVEFVEVDYRDSKTIEDIRDLRLRNGSWTLNRYRRDIGEEPIEQGGDDAVIQVRTGLIYWKDMAIYTMAEMAALAAAAIAAGVEPDFLLPGAALVPQPDPPAPVVMPTPTAPKNAKDDGKQESITAADLAQAANDRVAMVERLKAPRGADEETAAIIASYNRAYQHRRKQALRALPPV